MKTLFTLFFLITVLLLSNLQAETTVWSQNFDSMTPGTAPSGANIVVEGNNGSTQIVKIVDSTTTPTNPMSTNNSLMLEKTGGSTHVGVYFNSIPETSAGILTLDFYPVDDSGFTKPLLHLYTYDGPAGGNIGTFLYLTQSSVTVNSAGVNKSTNSGVIFNSINQLKIEFFTNNTYNVYVNDNLISFPTFGTDVPYYTNTFSGGIERIRVAIANGVQTEDRVFVDNIVLTIPEPSTVVLGGMAALMLGTTLYFRRRSHR